MQNKAELSEGEDDKYYNTDTVFHLTAAFGICSVVLVMQRLKLRGIQVKTNKFKEIVVLSLQVMVLEFLQRVKCF